MLLTACADEKMADAPKQIAEKIEIEQEEIPQVRLAVDSVVVEEPKVHRQKQSPTPIPPGPEPWIRPEPSPPRPHPPMPPMPPTPPGPEPIEIHIPEIDPSFPGGAAELMKFIKETIQYPEISKELGDQGRVYVEFIVEIDGSLTDVRVLRSLTPELDREAKRVIRSMPKWIPGEKGGEIVRSRARLPVTFTLN